MARASPEVRAAVLAEVKAGGTQREVADRHGVPAGTVAMWCAADKQPSGQAAKPKRAKAQAAKVAEKPKPVVQVVEKPPTPTAASRARLAAALAPTLGSELSEATAGLVSYLAHAGRTAKAYAADPHRAPFPPDMREVMNATKALTELVRGVGDILAIPAKTSPEEQDGDAAVDEIRRALAPQVEARAEKAPPNLRLAG